MGALDAGEVGFVPRQHGRLRQLQRKAELGIEAAEARLQHGVDLRARRLRPCQGLGQAAEGVVICPLGAELDAALPQGEDKVGHLGLDGRTAQGLEHVLEQLDVHRPHRVDLLGAGIELALLLLDTPAHVGDHRSILPAQAAQLQHLVVEVTAADVQHPARLGAQAGNAGRHRRAQYLLALAQHTTGQHRLQLGQGAGAQQGVVMGDLGNQALLSRHRQHLVLCNAQHGSRRGALALDLRLHFAAHAQGIPQGVDLVEHHQPGGVVFRLGGQMLPPDGQVRAGHAGVCAQDKDNAMRLGQQTHRQFRLCTHGIQARGIQDHQPLAEQRVGDIDQRMPPGGDLHHSLRIGQGIVLGQLVMPEAQRTRFVQRDPARLRHLAQRGGQLLGVIHIQRDLGPLFRHQTPFGQGPGLQTCLDGQQPQAGRHASVITQLRGTHGGAPRAGRHDAPAVARKEDGVDQLGLAARELGHKSHHHLVGSHLRLQPLEPLLDGIVHQLVVAHPLRQLLEAQGKFPAPCAMQIQLAIE